MIGAWRGAEVNAAARGVDGVVINVSQFQGKVVIREDSRRAACVHENVVMDAHSSGGLEKSLAWIVIEEVAVDLIHVGRARSRIREAAHQYIGPIPVGARLAVLDEDVVAYDRDARSGGHAGDAGPRKLPLDLHVVADGVFDQVVLYHAGEERRTSIGVP